MEPRPVLGAGDNRLLLVVVEDLLWYPAEEGKRPDVKGQEGLDLGGRHHLGIKRPGVAEDHGEEVERRQAP